MRGTRLGVMATLVCSAMVGSVSAGGWREAYRPVSSGCDLARGFATGALLAPRSAAARRPVRRLGSDGPTEAWTVGVGANPFGPSRHGTQGFAAVVGETTDLNGPMMSYVRKPVNER